jgi:hypothetical protein
MPEIMLNLSCRNYHHWKQLAMVTVKNAMNARGMKGFSITHEREILPCPECGAKCAIVTPAFEKVSDALSRPISRAEMDEADPPPEG